MSSINELIRKMKPKPKTELKKAGSKIRLAADKGKPAAVKKGK